MDQLDSASQVLYNGLEFHWLQVVGYRGAPDIALDGVTFDISGYQKFRRDKDHPFHKLELIPNGGQVVVIVGEWFEDADVQQQGGAGQGGANTGISELDSGPVAVAIGAAPTQILNPSNARVRGVTVQNIGTTVVAVSKRGSLVQGLGGATLLLAPGAAANDGNGDVATFDGWQGGIWAVNVAGGPGSVLVSAF